MWYRVYEGFFSMKCAFFYKERKAVFVMASLAIWFTLLTLFGPYLPANARTSVRQVVLNSNGHEITGEWVRKNNRWTFRKIVSLKKVDIKRASNKADLSDHEPKNLRSSTGVASLGTDLAGRTVAGATSDISSAKTPVASVPASVTTASIAAVKAVDKMAARAVRQKLAEEIGRWAKIGDRWEWHKGSVNTKVFSVPRDELLSEYTRWQRRDGFWVFDADARLRLFLII